MKIFIYIILLFLLFSCENSVESTMEKKIVMFCYGSADSSLSRVTLSRFGKLTERINQENLGLSGGTITLYENGKLIGELSEYEDENGVYYLDSPFTFKVDSLYSLKASVEGYPSVEATTTCPRELEDIEVFDPNKNSYVVPMSLQNGLDTLNYIPGLDNNSNALLQIGFNSEPLLAESRMASFSIVPDHREREYWLEQFEDYEEDVDFSTRVFKSEDSYGEDIFEFMINYGKVWWFHLYHKGEATIVVSACDNPYFEYVKSLDQNSLDPYTNVENGSGLFTLRNSSSNGSRYRVYIKQ